MQKTASDDWSGRDPISGAEGEAETLRQKDRFMTILCKRDQIPPTGQPIFRESLRCKAEAQGIELLCAFFVFSSKHCKEKCYERIKAYSLI